jgi:NitT/TauT family transport system ATP-binding protein
MDEPFSALDVHTRLRMEAELLTLWEGPGSSGPLPHTALTAEDAENAQKRFALRAPRAPRLKKTVVFVTHDLEEAIALADEVIVLSAGPSARLVARHEVTIDRPRDLMELRTSPAFVDLYRALWVVLREEVVKSQRTEEPARG